MQSILNENTYTHLIALLLTSCSGIDLRPRALPKPSDDGLVRKSKSAQYRVPQIFVSNPTGYCKMTFVGQNSRSRSSEIEKLVGKSYGIGNYSRIFNFYPVPDRYYTITAKFDRIDGKASSGDIDDIDPINDSDFNCLQEIRAVLKKHDRLKRFGVALLHTHFPIGSDEILLETANNKSRELVIKPTKQTDAGENNVGTIWALGEGDNIQTMAWCRRYCERVFLGGHFDSHNSEE